ncbi:MAG: Gfo/Idh/MocA family oxidoreductase [Bacteroidia bacterium]|nr:Gfo/Idh/MocA family oxidoreductase [Bacteroidia bacterium]
MFDKSNRRDFLKRSAAVATGALILPQIIPSTALGMGGKLPPSDRIVMGAIGTGSQGTSNLKGFLGRVKELQFVAVCDVDTSHSAKAKGLIDEVNKNNDCRTYGDYREFLEKEKLDAVSIALPDHWHGIIYSSAANKKLDIYGEKPLARTINDSKAIVSAVKANNIIWQTGSWQRSQEHFRRGAELAINGRVGKIIRVEVGLPDGGKGIGTPPVLEAPAELNWEIWLGPAPKVPYRGVSHWNWRWILDYSGGQLTDWSGHHIDIAQWGIGMERSGPIEISGEGVYPRDGIYNAPVEYDFTCKYANGIEMRVANASRLRFGMGATWYGEKGWIHVDRGNVLKASDPKILEEVIGECEIHLYKSDNHIGNFLESIKSRGETVAPVEIAHRSISVGLLGEIAMTTGQKIQWDPVKQEMIGNLIASRLLSRPYRQPWSLPTI